jgi:polyphosphate kinase
MHMTKTVKVPTEISRFCKIKAEKAEDLTVEDIRVLTNWCDWQTASLWDGMSLQEILNVYRATAEYDTFEGWADEDWKAAYKAWNKAVIKPGNKMRPRV